MTPQTLAFGILLACLLAVGVVLAAKRPRNAIGWLMLLVVALFAAAWPAVALADALREAAPTAAAWLYWYGADRPDTWTWILPVGILLGIVPQVFPDGRTVSRPWTWFLVFSIATIVLSAAILSTVSAEVAPGVANPVHAPLPDAVTVVAPVLGVTLFGGAVTSLVVRYRRAGETLRAQIRWVMWAVGVGCALLVSSWAVPSAWDAVNALVLASYAIVPISIAVAVLRYRLYDIDRIISRTVAYTGVTLTVAAVYTGVVTSVTWLLPEAPSIAVAGATLAAAAAFLPILRVAQRIVDRRFDRARYDAEHIVDAYGTHLRDEVDPDAAAASLHDAVSRALQPVATGLWVKEHVR